MRWLMTVLLGTAVSLSAATAPAATEVHTILQAHALIVETHIIHNETLFGSSTNSPWGAADLTAADGTPLEGRTITFTAGGELLCTATTDARGYAACDASPGAVAMGRYEAGFVGEIDGDIEYLPSSDEATLLQVNDEDGPV